MAAGVVLAGSQVAHVVVEAGESDFLVEETEALVDDQSAHEVLLADAAITGVGNPLKLVSKAHSTIYFIELTDWKTI